MTTKSTKFKQQVEKLKKELGALIEATCHNEKYKEYNFDQIAKANDISGREVLRQYRKGIGSPDMLISTYEKLSGEKIDIGILIKKFQ